MALIRHRSSKMEIPDEPTQIDLVVHLKLAYGRCIGWKILASINAKTENGRPDLIWKWYQVTKKGLWQDFSVPRSDQLLLWFFRLDFHNWKLLFLISPMANVSLFVLLILFLLVTAMGFCLLSDFWFWDSVLAILQQPVWSDQQFVVSHSIGVLVWNSLQQLLWPKCNLICGKSQEFGSLFQQPVCSNMSWFQQQHVLNSLKFHQQSMSNLLTHQPMFNIVLCDNWRDKGGLGLLDVAVSWPRKQYLCFCCYCFGYVSFSHQVCPMFILWFWCSTLFSEAIRVISIVCFPPFSFGLSIWS